VLQYTKILIFIRHLTFVIAQRVTMFRINFMFVMRPLLNTLCAETRSRYSDSLRAGRSGDLILKYFTSVQTGPGAQPVSYTMGILSFPGEKRPGCGDDRPPHLMPRLKKE